MTVQLIRTWPQTTALVIAGAFTLMAPIAVGVLAHDVGLATLVAATGAFVCLLVRIEDITELTLGPLAAKMRETVREATATVEQLKSLAITNAKVQLDASVANNDMKRRQRWEMRERFREALTKLGVDEATRAEVEQRWRADLAWRHALAIRSLVFCPAPAGEPNPNLWKLQIEFDSLSPSQGLLTQRVADFLTSNGVSPLRAQEMVEDLRYFESKFELRRPEAFFGADKT